MTIRGGLYNGVLGQQPYAEHLIQMLDLWKVGGVRLRDAWLNWDGSEIIVLTRNGGGNRSHYGEHDSGRTCDCVGCAIMYWLPKHDYYIRDWDDEFDRTYAYVRFRVPPPYQDQCLQWATGAEPPSFRERFEAAMEKMKHMTTEEVQEMTEHVMSFVEVRSISEL